jgi:hypothetical protein
VEAGSKQADLGDGDAMRLDPYIRGAALLLAAMCLLLGVLTTAAPRADAQAPGARFTYELCDPALPGGESPAFEFHPEPGYAPFLSCALPGGFLQVGQVEPVNSLSGLMNVAVEATPGGYVESETITANATNLQPGAGASGVIVAGWPPSNIGDVPRTFYVNPEPPCPSCSRGGGFTIALTCSGTCEAGGGVAVKFIAVTEVDPKPPQVEKVEGALVGGGVLRGTQPLSATATDQGGGVSTLKVLVNGTVAPGAVSGSCAAMQVKNPSYQGLAAYSVTPCPGVLPGTWSLNTSEPPFHEGGNTVQVCATDFATEGQPNATCSPPQTVEVDNSCTESAVGGGANLTAGIQKSPAERVKLRHGRGTEIRGTLTYASGAPVQGAMICVQSALEGSGPVPVATVTTEADGQFGYGVGPGPNRQILVGYRHGSFELDHTLTIDSSAQPKLTAAPAKLHNGEKVHLSGRLPEPSAAGRVVVLQANVPGGHRWITFRKATTGPRGRFKANYHFTSTTRKIIYRFRALVPRQAGYPWEQGASRPASVMVSR